MLCGRCFFFFKDKQSSPRGVTLEFVLVVTSVIDLRVAVARAPAFRANRTSSTTACGSLRPCQGSEEGNRHEHRLLV